MPGWYPFAAAGLLTTVLLAFARLGVRLTARGKDMDVAIGKGNMALGLVYVADVLSIFLIAGSITTNCVEGDPKHDALFLTTFGGAGALLYYAASRAGMRVLLHARLQGELARGNTAAGVAAAAHAIATGIVTAHAFGGDDWESLGLSLSFFVIAQVTLHVFVILFRALTSYDDAEEILGENMAAAISYAGLTLGIALIVGHAVEGDFEGWQLSTKGYVLALGYALGLYLVRQVLVQGIVLGHAPSFRGGKLDSEIGIERNTAMASLEAVAYVATALLVGEVG